MSFFISLAAIVAICLFVTVRFKANSAWTPFFVVAFITLFSCYLGTLNLLVPAIYLVLAFAVFSLVYVFILKRKDLKANLLSFLSPGMVFFIASSIFFFFALQKENAAFSVWDEFSFWGTAAKNVFAHRQLYTLFESSMINISYPPVLPVFSFFMQFFGGAFSEYMVYVAYAVIEMAVVTILFSRIRWKNPVAIVVVAFFALAGIYSFWWGFEGLIAYCTSYADYILGFVFAAPLLIYFSSDDKSLIKYLGVLLGLMLLPLTKDIGFAFGLIASVVIAADMVLANNYPSERVFKSENKWLRLVYPAALFIAVIASYFIWTLHFNAVTELSRVEVSYSYSIFDMLRGKDDYFNQIIHKMFTVTSTKQLVTFGTINVMLVVFFIVPIIVSLFTKSKRQILRTLLFSFLMLCGFLLYSVFQSYLYTAIFVHTESHDLISYTRYMSSYAIGWFFIMTGVCLFDITKPFFKRLSLSLGVAVCAVLLSAHFYFCNVHPDQYVFTSEKVICGPNEMRRRMSDITNKFDGYLTSDDKIYFIAQNSDGGEWFIFNYQAQPAYTVKTLGGGNFVSLDTPKEDMVGTYNVYADKKIFTDYIREQGIDYVYIFVLDDYFISEFSDMFEDKLVTYFDNSSGLYMVVDKGADLVSFVPVPTGMAIENLKAEYGVD